MISDQYSKVTLSDIIRQGNHSLDFNRPIEFAVVFEGYLRVRSLAEMLQRGHPNFILLCAEIMSYIDVQSNKNMVILDRIDNLTYVQQPQSAP